VADVPADGRELAWVSPCASDDPLRPRLTLRRTFSTDASTLSRVTSDFGFWPLRNRIEKFGQNRIPKASEKVLAILPSSSEPELMLPCLSAGPRRHRAHGHAPHEPDNLLQSPRLWTSGSLPFRSHPLLPRSRRPS
jgi:hypothetical protein